MDEVGKLWHGAVICIGIILLMAFLTACENSIVELSDSEVRRLTDTHKRGKTISKLLDKPNRFVMVNLLSRSVLIILLSAAAAVYFFVPTREFIKDLTGMSRLPLFLIAIFIVVCISALAVSVFGIIPKRLCASGKLSSGFAVSCCGVYRALLALFIPLETAAELFSSLFLRIFGVKELPEQESVTEEEILMMVDAVNETGGIEESQAEMISNIFQFDDLKVHEIMTHRTEVVGVEQNCTLREAVQMVIDEGFSRIPVFEENIDNICGVVFAKDLLKALFSGDHDGEPVKEFMREIRYIPESSSCSELFEYFTTKKNHIAVAVDEYGGTAGIITLEDLLESIVGNIQDEYDDEEEEIQEITPNTFDILGKAGFSQVMERLGCQTQEEHDTLGGFLAQLFGGIPAGRNDASIKWKNIKFTVIKADEKHIEKVRAVILNTED